MNDAELGRRSGGGRSGLTGLAWIAWLGLVLYPLSIGPAAKLVEWHVLPAQTENLYAPLLLLARHNETAEEALTWYVLDVWRFKILH